MALASRARPARRQVSAVSSTGVCSGIDYLPCVWGSAGGQIVVRWESGFGISMYAAADGSLGATAGVSRFALLRNVSPSRRATTTFGTLRPDSVRLVAKRIRKQ